MFRPRFEGVRAEIISKTQRTNTRLIHSLVFLQPSGLNFLECRVSEEFFGRFRKVRSIGESAFFIDPSESLGALSAQRPVIDARIAGCDR